MPAIVQAYGNIHAGEVMAKIQPTKKDHEEYDEILARLEEHLTTQDEAVAKYNDAIRKANEWIETYNGILNDLNGFADGVYSHLQGAFDDRSEKWQESEAGSDTQELVNSWEEVYDLTGYPETEIEEAYKFVSNDLLENLGPKWEVGK
jgi:hypothetical protein